MVESLTQNYKWTKPEVTKSASTWGGFLNTDLDSIDAIVFSNQQGIVPIGAITMFAGATAPANWLICDGRSLDTTAYAALFAVLQYVHGGSGANFNLPNLSGVFPRGVGASNPIGQVGGSNSYTIDVAHLPPHAHPIVDVAHNHGAYQNAHAHGIATGGHSHTISTGSHAHSGVVVPGGTFSLGVSGWTTQPGNTSTVGDLGGSASFVGNLGGNTDTQQPGVGIYAPGTGLSTTANAGAGAAMSIVPSYVALNFLIRYQ